MITKACHLSPLLQGHPLPSSNVPLCGENAYYGTYLIRPTFFRENYKSAPRYNTGKDLDYDNSNSLFSMPAKTYEFMGHHLQNARTIETIYPS